MIKHCNKRFGASAFSKLLLHVVIPFITQNGFQQTSGNGVNLLHSAADRESDRANNIEREEEGLFLKTRQVARAPVDASACRTSVQTGDLKKKLFLFVCPRV